MEQSFLLVPPLSIKGVFHHVALICNSNLQKTENNSLAAIEYNTALDILTIMIE